MLKMLAALFDSTNSRAAADALVPLLLLLFGVFLRLSTGLHFHSGEGKGPMFGDFEAQRHWVEITNHLDLDEWYMGKHEDNDLQYWGLDYPPLTAYHSWLIGKIYYLLYPPWGNDFFALRSSRGNEDCKFFLRIVCLLSEIVVYFPACIFYCHKVLPARCTGSQRLLCLALLVCCPPFVMIDLRICVLEQSGHERVVFF